MDPDLPPDLYPDPAPDPAIFVIDLQDANKKLDIFFKLLYLLLFEGIHLHHISKIKCHKEVTKQ
jgi:hypothetical protein